MAPPILASVDDTAKPAEASPTLADVMRQASQASPASPAPKGKPLGEALAALAAPTPPLATVVPAVGRAKRRALQRLGDSLMNMVGKSDILPGLREELDKIDALGAMAKTLKTPQDFANKTAEFKRRLAAGETLADIRNEAYAVAREACAQALPSPAPGVRMFPFGEQMLGALAMEQGRVAEMRTGEGKTLTAVMPCYLNSLAGKGVHLVTANETLAQRDAKEMEPAYQLLGVSVANVLEDMSPEQKRQGYNADITYTTNSALGFDYLRDRICRSPEQRVQRPPFFALVDEVDEVLIDEARTPLIISQKSDPSLSHYQTFSNLVGQMVPGEDYQVDREKHVAYLTESGQDWMSNELGMRRSQGHLSRALSAAREAIHSLSSAPSEEVKARLQRRIDRATAIAERAHDLIDGGEALRPAIRKEAKLAHELEQYSAGKKSRIDRVKEAIGGLFHHAPPPAFDPKVEAEKKAAVEAARAEKEALLKGQPVFNIYAPGHNQEVAYMQRALDAVGLYSLDKDYTIAYGEKLEGDLRAFCKNQLKLPGNEQIQTKVLLASQVLEPELATRMNVGHQEEDWITPDLAGTTGAALAQLLTDKAKDQKCSVADYLDKLLTDQAQAQGRSPENQLAQTKRDFGELKIVDEFKGRVADGRRFNDGLHQALEAKEGLEVGAEQRSVATISYPNLFRRYERLAGMSGTAKVAEKEFQSLYNLAVVVIPTHKKVELSQQPDMVFRTLKEKYQAVVDDAKRCYEEGIPVLVGTRSVEVNREIVKLLAEAGVPCQALNADNIKHNTEAENALLARAGLSGWVTVATNMAGRGVDIKEDQASFKRISLLATQLSHPDLVALYHKDMANPAEAPAWSQFLKLCKIDPKEFATLAAQAQEKGQKALPLVIDVATPKEASRLAEWFNSSPDLSGGVAYQVASGDAPPTPGVVQIRVNPTTDPAPGCLRLKSSDFPTGGLRIIGTERHTSPRIDLQLTGRAARQGRPGSAQFYLSLQDDLLKIYGADALGKIMNLMGVAQGQGVSNPALAKFVANCQQKIENVCFDSRSDTTKYDGIMNKHRDLYFGMHEAVVDSRGSVSTPEDDRIDLRQTVLDWTVDALVHGTKLEFAENQRDPETADQATYSKHKPEVVRQALSTAIQKLGLPIQVVSTPGRPGDIYIDPHRKVATDRLDDLIRPAVVSAYEDLQGQIKYPAEELAAFQQEKILDAMDAAWTDHLEIMNGLRNRANLLSYGGKEPFKEYEKMAFYAFEDTCNTFKTETASQVFAGMRQAADRSAAEVTA